MSEEKSDRQGKKASIKKFVIWFVAILIIILLLGIIIPAFSPSNRNHEPQKANGDVSVNLEDIKKDPNAYYDGCVTCTLTVEKKGILSKLIFVKTTFKNETDYPIPVEERHVFISRDGKTNVMEAWAFDVYRDGEEVQYLGSSVDRDASKFPQDYYILPPHDAYVALINLSKYYDLSKKGKYSVKYWASNSLDTIVFGAEYDFVIEPEPVEFEIK